jgi:hypothetical protein
MVMVASNLRAKETGIFTKLIGRGSREGESGLV